MHKKGLKYIIFDIGAFYNWPDQQCFEFLISQNNTPFPFRNKMPHKNPEKTSIK